MAMPPSLSPSKGSQFLSSTDDGRPNEPKPREPGDRIPSIMDRTQRQRSDPSPRPATIAELANRARQAPWDPSKGIMFWMKIAGTKTQAGNSRVDAGDLESAVVEYIQAATIILEKLPAYPEYNLSLNAEQRHNLKLSGQRILKELSKIKPIITLRHERWLAQHPDADIVLNGSSVPLAKTGQMALARNTQTLRATGTTLETHHRQTHLSTDREFDHSQILPLVETTLDDALSNFGFEALLNDPQAWVEKNCDHIEASIWGLELATTTGIEAELRMLVNRKMIFKRLLCYTFIHLKLCSTEAGLLFELQGVCDQWKSLDDVALLLQHRSIKHTLKTFIKKGLSSDHHAPETLSELMKLEVIGLCAHLTHVLEDTEKCKILLTLKNSEDAQSILDLIQMCLELPLDPSIKRLHFRTLVKMSRTYGLYPNCLVLRGIEMNAFTPEAAGAYGDIYRGMFQGKALALKVLRVYQTSDMLTLLKGFSAEAVIWRQLNHPNVSPFYGIYHLEDTRVCFASPWMENGNIVQFLKRYPNTVRFPLVMDIIQGLAYLHGHEPSIIHADLKGVNILVTPAHRACLADFGLATVKDSKQLTLTASSKKSVGTIRWQAPELLDPSQGPVPNTKNSDIYAFACVCYEVFTGELPFYEFSHDYPVIFAVVRGQRPSRPSPDRNGLDDNVWRIIAACWARKPSQRPTASHVIECLSGLPKSPQDRRPTDNFDNPFSSQILYPKGEHPAPAHHLSGEHMKMLRAWQSSNSTAPTVSNRNSTTEIPLYGGQRSAALSADARVEGDLTAKSTRDLKKALDHLSLPSDAEWLKHGAEWLKPLAPHRNDVRTTKEKYSKSRLESGVLFRTGGSSDLASTAFYALEEEEDPKGVSATLTVNPAVASQIHRQSAIPALPQGPTTTAQVMDAFRVAHGHLLSTMATVTRYAHPHFASASNEIHKLFDEIIDVVCIVLIISDSVVRSHYTMPETTRLRIAKDGLFHMATAVGEAARALDSDMSFIGTEEGNRTRILTSATNALTAGAECVETVRACIHTTITDLEPLFIDMPVAGEPNAWRRHAIIQTYQSDATEEFF